MSDRPRYVWRVTAVWPDRSPRTRCYFSKQAAEHRAAVWREGRAPVEEYDHLNGSVEVVAQIAPAATVTIERSAAVTGWQSVTC